MFISSLISWLLCQCASQPHFYFCDAEDMIAHVMSLSPFFVEIASSCEETPIWLEIFRLDSNDSSLLIFLNKKRMSYLQWVYEVWRLHRASLWVSKTRNTKGEWSQRDFFYILEKTSPSIKHVSKLYFWKNIETG